MIEIDIALRRGAFPLAVAFASPARLTALFGRSGAGKSSLIGAVAGLLRPDRGHIAVNGTVLFDSDSGIDVAPHKRRVGLVFQDAQLFPHLSVERNLRYGAWLAPKADAGLGFEAVVEVLGIRALLGRDTASLSGGERQRVAIGRAVLSRPRLLLMDEPLASLDAPRRLEILPMIEHVRDAFGVPILYVSHAVEEVARLAGEVVMLEGGRVAGFGPPGAVLAPGSGPVSERRFGQVSLISARIESHDQRYGLTMLSHPAGPISVPGRVGQAGAPARVLVRGTDVSLALKRPRGTSVRTVLSGIVERIEVDAGAVAQVDLALPGGDRLAAFVTRKSVDELGLGEGDAVFAMIKSASIEQGAGRG